MSLIGSSLQPNKHETMDRTIDNEHTWRGVSSFQRAKLVECKFDQPQKWFRKNMLL